MGITQGVLVKGYSAGAAILARKIVKFGAADNAVITAAAATDLILGVSAPDVDVAINDTCDVHLSGIVEVIAGGTITRGDMVTSDASGNAVSTTTAANRVLGIAEVSAVAGDILTVFLAPHLI